MTASKNDISDNIDFSEVFSHVNADEIVKPFDEYTLALSSFFTTYTTETRNTLIRTYRFFNPKKLNPEETSFVSEALKLANYDESALQGESVVLFSTPVIVSELSCGNVSKSENEGAVRLISYRGIDKRFATKRTTRITYGESISTYKIYDIALGLILPKGSTFISARVVDASSLVTDIENLDKAKDALNRAREIPLLEMQKIKDKLDNINSVIDVKRGLFESISSNISILEQERSHAENSLARSQNALEKVIKDIDKSNIEYAQLSTVIANESERLMAIEKRIEAKADSYKKEESKLESLAADTEKTSAALIAVQKELADANRQKNLTTLDMVGHSNETSKQLKLYYFLAIITFIALAFMARYIYKNGESFMYMVPFLGNVSAWDILLSRLPLITATTLIIGGLSGVFFFLVKHIVSLNTEKMAMLKAAILAEQITNSMECEHMSEREKLEFKRDTKIRLITQVFSKNEPEIDRANFMMDILKAVIDKK
ncbi:zinc ribbon domain-containing protein [Aeromonas schubertii]